MALFSEYSEEFREMPEWVKFLISFGLRWPSDKSRKKRIALVSMPCDSPAAGLIALGSLISDLKNPRSNALDGHLDSIRNYAKQYLNYCKDCQFTPCNPEQKNCGYIKESTGWLKHNEKRNKYRISDKSKLEEIRNPQTMKEFIDFHTNQSWLFVEDRGSSVPIEHFEQSDDHRSQLRKYIFNWHIHDEPPAYLEKSERELSGSLYSKITDEVSFFPENLKRSYSGLCLAGRLAGKAKIKELCETIKISGYYLSELLTIQDWSSSNSISRMTFFNARTENSDRRINNTRLVVADGDDCFLKILRHSEFQNSDIIGVIHRTMNREKLEEVGNKLSELKQWFRNDKEILNIFDSIPYGISIVVLEKDN